MLFGGERVEDYQVLKKFDVELKWSRDFFSKCQ
jgi:hypothetical protein